MTDIPSPAERAAAETPAAHHFEAFYRTHRPRLVGYLTLLTGMDSRFVEDIAQEALLVVRRNWKRINEYPSPNLVGYLFRTARRALARESLAWSADSLPDVVEEHAAEDLYQIDRVLDVRAAVAGLPRRQREVTILYYMIGYRVDEVASILGIAPGTVKATLFQARSRLEGLLTEPEPASRHHPEGDVR